MPAPITSPSGLRTSTNRRASRRADSYELPPIRRHIATAACIALCNVGHGRWKVSAASGGAVDCTFVGCGLIAQHEVQQCAMDRDLAVVVDEPHSPEFVHEIVDARTGRANHLRQRLL